MTNKTLAVEKIKYTPVPIPAVAVPAPAPIPIPAGFYTKKDDPIDYEFTNKGSLIDYACWEKITDDYWNPDPHLPPHSKVLHLFSKQILLFLLSFEECQGLAMTKCIKPGAAGTHEESIAIHAIDKNGKPLGWDDVTSTEILPRKFGGGEWGMSVTYKQFKDSFVKKGLDGRNYIDKKLLFSFMDNMLNDKNTEYKSSSEKTI